MYNQGQINNNKKKPQQSNDFTTSSLIHCGSVTNVTDFLCEQTRFIQKFKKDVESNVPRLESNMLRVHVDIAKPAEAVKTLNLSGSMKLHTVTQINSIYFLWLISCIFHGNPEESTLDTFYNRTRLVHRQNSFLLTTWQYVTELVCLE